MALHRHVHFDHDLVAIGIGEELLGDRAHADDGEREDADDESPRRSIYDRRKLRTTLRRRWYILVP